LAKKLEEERGAHPMTLRVDLSQPVGRVEAILPAEGRKNSPQNILKIFFSMLISEAADAR